MEGNTASAVNTQLPSSATYSNNKLIFLFNDGRKQVWSVTPEALFNHFNSPFTETLTWKSVADTCQVQQ